MRLKSPFFVWSEFFGVNVRSFTLARKVCMRFADPRILLFDLGEAILPSRSQLQCATVWSGGHPKGLSLTAVSIEAGLAQLAQNRPSSIGKSVA